MLDLGYKSDFVILTRPAREVALSYYRNNIIPGRSVVGWQYCYKPRDPGVLLNIKYWDYWTDYMMCYWYALEIERRQQYYREKLPEWGMNVYEIASCDIVSQPHFMCFVEQLGLPMPNMEKYDAVKNLCPNKTESQAWPVGGMDEQEQAILSLL